MFVIVFAFQLLAGFSSSLGRVLVLTLTVRLTLSAPFFVSSRPYRPAAAPFSNPSPPTTPCLYVMPCQHNLMCYSVLYFCGSVCVCEWVGAVNLAAKVCNSSFIFTPTKRPTTTPSPLHSRKLWLVRHHLLPCKPYKLRVLWPAFRQITI